MVPRPHLGTRAGQQITRGIDVRKQPTKAKLLRSYRCSDCASRLTEKYIDGEWLVCCCACNGTKFAHEYKVRQQKAEAQEVLDGLPGDMVIALGYKPKRRGTEIFSLSPLPESEI